jgi:hypothetical protein
MMPDKEIRQIAREELSKFKLIPKGCKPFSNAAKSVAVASAAGVTKTTARQTIASVLKQLPAPKKGIWMSDPRLAEILPKDTTEYTVEHGHVKLLFTHAASTHPGGEILQVSCWYHPA